MLKKISGALVAVAPAVFPLASQAAVPEAVTTAMTAMQTDGIAVATAFLVASIAITAFLFMRRGAK
jgi:hypothetical protein